MFIQLYNFFIVNKALIIHFNKTTRKKKANTICLHKNVVPTLLNIKQYIIV